MTLLVLLKRCNDSFLFCSVMWHCHLFFSPHLTIWCVMWFVMNVLHRFSAPLFCSPERPDDITPTDAAAPLGKVPSLCFLTSVSSVSLEKFSGHYRRKVPAELYVEIVCSPRPQKKSQTSRLVSARVSRLIAENI